MALRPVSVSELNSYIERVVTTDPLLRSVVVRGEISSVKYHQSGHIYLSLSDPDSKIDCVIWRDTAMSLRDMLKVGDEVIVTGSLRLYKKTGLLQFSIRQLEIAGAGAAAAAFERMKERLAKEGLFDPAHKKKLPSFPARIGLVTSATGAAVEDMLRIIRERTRMTDVLIFPVPVQGMGAGEEIARMIRRISALDPSPVDLLIVGRGGGSPEDLMAFNEEALARAIYDCPLPVISAVGHEIDFSISDFVADARAATPTAGAQMAVPDDRELAHDLEKAREQLNLQLTNRLMYEELRLSRLSDRLKSEMRAALTGREQELERLKLDLTRSDPRALLEGGYAIVTGDDGKAVRSAGSLDVGGEYGILFYDGTARCTVTAVTESEEKR